MPLSHTINPRHFQSDQLKQLSQRPIPRHIAVIPDGNRRWARERGLPSLEGHRAGMNAVMRLVRAAQELGIKQLTLYGFSTENWTRPQEEIIPMLLLIAGYLIQERADMVANGIRLRAIGDLVSLPQFLQDTLQDSIQATRQGIDFDLVLALNYGARNELCRAFKRILTDMEQGVRLKQDLSEAMVADYLDTAGLSDPDLLIRTSGEFRLSNFMLWQSAYAEFLVLDLLWPDFTPDTLLHAVKAYQVRERRAGA